MNKPLIEACVDSYQSCVNAWKGGADRFELCAHLAIGGSRRPISCSARCRKPARA